MIPFTFQDNFKLRSIEKTILFPQHYSKIDDSNFPVFTLTHPKKIRRKQKYQWIFMISITTDTIYSLYPFYIFFSFGRFKSIFPRFQNGPFSSAAKCHCCGMANIKKIRTTTTTTTRRFHFLQKYMEDDVIITSRTCFVVGI